MCQTPYLSSDTICSGRTLVQFNVGDELVLIQRVILANGTPQFVAITGTVTGLSPCLPSNIYSYISDTKDHELAGLNISFISNGVVVRNNSYEYATKTLSIDMIQPYSPIHNNTVTFKTIGVLCPERFISLRIAFKTNTSVTHTFLITNYGFMIVIS